MDIFFSRACSGMARFRPEDAMAKYKELISDVIGRTGFSQQIGLIAIQPHTSLVSRQNALDFISQLKIISEKDIDGNEEKQRTWMVISDYLKFSFPLLTGKEQLDFLLYINMTERLCSSFLESSYCVNEDYYTNLITEAWDNNDDKSLFTLLVFAVFSDTPLSKKSIHVVKELIKSSSELIRIWSLNLACISKAPELILEVIESGWATRNDKSMCSDEHFYGSLALFEGVRQKLVSLDQIIARLDPCAYPHCIDYLNKKELGKVALKIEEIIHHLFSCHMVPRDLDLNFGFFSFAELMISSEGMADRLYELFISQPENLRFGVRKYAILCIGYFAAINPEQAASLYELIRGVDSFHNTSDLESQAIWRGQDISTLNQLRANRLDRAKNDYDIFLEVKAGLENGKEGLLMEYARSKLATPEPSNISRGLMVLGFCDQSRETDHLLMEPDNKPGFIGQARHAAKYAYERNVWAKHWFGIMCRAKTPEEFWPASVLFLKIVDGRFSLWRDEFESGGAIMKKFWPSLDGALKSRLKQWKDKRTDELFGQKAPPKRFLG